MSAKWRKAPLINIPRTNSFRRVILPASYM